MGEEENHFVLELDNVSDTKIFYLASIYYLFPHDIDIPGKSLASGKQILLNEPSKLLVKYFLYNILGQNMWHSSTYLFANATWSHASWFGRDDERK